MTRGKYAAKAVNRIAALDNELLSSTRAEVVELRNELQSVRSELYKERREQSGLVIRRADELSAAIVSALRSELAQVKSAHLDELHMIAELVAMKIREASGERVAYPSWFLADVIPILIRDRRKRAEFINTIITEGVSIK